MTPRCRSCASASTPRTRRVPSPVPWCVSRTKSCSMQMYSGLGATRARSATSHVSKRYERRNAAVPRCQKVWSPPALAISASPGWPSPGAETDAKQVTSGSSVFGARRTGSAKNRTRPPSAASVTCSSKRRATTARRQLCGPRSSAAFMRLDANMAENARASSATRASGSARRGAELEALALAPALAPAGSPPPSRSETSRSASASCARQRRRTRSAST
mmetsp:Transcript_7414/g.23709  ORF Transcript_7414/g.23709 Transcript_7414/m.23709 type:complete len:219 (-) Transcript_7414:108-764(-)